MKLQSILFFFLLTIGQFVSAQEPPSFLDLPEFSMERQEVEANLRFLSSDILQGRRTGSQGNNIAAQFLADHYKAYGLQFAPGMDSYFQKVAFVTSSPPATAKLKIGKSEYKQGGDMMVLTGDPGKLDKARLVFANQGWVDAEAGVDDYKGLDVKGKIVIVDAGTPEGKDPLTIFKAMAKKREMAKEKGAAALFELYQMPVPWQFFKNYFGGSTLRLASENEMENEGGKKIPYGWIRNLPKNLMGQLKAKKKIKTSLVNSGSSKKIVYSQNVCGIIEGRDADLKDEFVLLTAHYDHVGTGKDGGGAFSEKDSVFNGARDNGMGTIALLSAAKALSKRKPLRSVIVLAVTGEEVGLLGSQYYAAHPLVPLNKTIFNLNTDGAGYNDTSYVSVVGYGRTGTDEQIEQGVAPFGLKVFPNPAPEQGLYDRSDNVSFASKGVPAVNYSPGVTGFDAELMKYYHQVADEADSVDFDYFLKYCKSFSHTARIIADGKTRPWWTPGDKYEGAGNELFEKN